MPRTVLLSSLLLALLLPCALFAEGEEPEGGIAWEKDLSTAMAAAKEKGRILMICVNAKHVDGRQDEEPAAEGLREVVYRDPRIVKRSRDFVCVMMTPKSSTADHGVLGSLGVEGEIISPQHLFANPEGDKLLFRREYWRHGKGEKAVEALLGMMEKAEQKNSAAGDAPAPTPEGDGPPEEGEARAKWIADMLEQLEGTAAERDQALAALIENDVEGDCINPLIELLPKKKREVELLKALIRALGRNELEDAAKPISDFLTHKDPSIRANAAVSLEYIGSTEKKVVSALMKAAGKQRDEGIANHIFRALGRCGVGDSKARGLLLKMAANGKSELASYGPAIGLAYFKGDAVAARGVEKILKVIGVPGGGRGGGQNIVKRALVSWTLASIEDPKSSKFVREELIAKLENMRAFWVEGLRNFYISVIRACDGEGDALGEVEIGVGYTVGFARNTSPDGELRPLMDESRLGREDINFKPKGDNILGIGEDD